MEARKIAIDQVIDSIHREYILRGDGRRLSHRPRKTELARRHWNHQQAVESRLNGMRTVWLLEIRWPAEEYRQ
jgi:hypothetical protein